MSKDVLDMFARYKKHIEYEYQKHKINKDQIVARYYQDVSETSEYFDYDVFDLKNVDMDLLVKSYDEMYAHLYQKKWF